jgi:hypothetical protein
MGGKPNFIVVLLHISLMASDDISLHAPWRFEHFGMLFVYLVLRTAHVLLGLFAFLLPTELFIYFGT